MVRSGYQAENALNFVRQVFQSQLSPPDKNPASLVKSITEHDQSAKLDLNHDHPDFVDGHSLPKLHQR